MVFYTLVLQFYSKKDKGKKKMTSFSGKKQKENKTVLS